MKIAVAGTGYVGLVTENSAMSSAGIEEGDRIISINGMKTNTWDKIQIALSLKNDGALCDM